MKRSSSGCTQSSQTEILLDAAKREGRFLSALRVPNAEQLVPWYNGEQNKKEEHFFATVIATCGTCQHWRDCTHVKSHFQSTKDSKRLVHVYFFWKTVLGKDFPITDEMLLDKAWKNLDSTCEYGVKKENGHAKRSGGPVCLNPHHYAIADYRRMLQVLIECVVPIFGDNDTIMSLVNEMTFPSRSSSEQDDCAKFQKFVYHLQQESSTLTIVSRKKPKKSSKVQVQQTQKSACISNTLEEFTNNANILMNTNAPSILTPTATATAKTCKICGSGCCSCSQRKNKRANPRAACISSSNEVKPFTVPTEITHVTDITLVDKLTQPQNFQLEPSSFDLDFDTSSLQIPWSFLEDQVNYDYPAEFDGDHFLENVNFPSIDEGIQTHQHQADTFAFSINLPMCQPNYLPLPLHTSVAALNNSNNTTTAAAATSLLFSQPPTTAFPFGLPTLPTMAVSSAAMPGKQTELDLTLMQMRNLKSQSMF